MIHFALQSKKSDPAYSKRVIVLALCWIFGLLFGLFFVSSAGENASDIIVLLSHQKASFLGLAAITLTPLIVSFAAIKYKKIYFLFPICFLKAFAYSSCLMSICVCFGSAAWLIRALLLFSDSCAVILLLWFCCRGLTCGKVVIKQDIAVCSLVTAAVCTIDYLFVSPYLAKLMHLL